VAQTVLVWFGAGRTSLVWCSTVVDVLIVSRDITDGRPDCSSCSSIRNVAVTHIAKTTVSSLSPVECVL
jgi:hypothetical protein